MIHESTIGIMRIVAICLWMYSTSEETFFPKTYSNIEPNVPIDFGLILISIAEFMK